MCVLRRTKPSNRLFVAAAEQLFVARKGNKRACRASLRSLRQIKTVDRIQKEESANSVVEVLTAVPQPFQFRHLRLELAQAGSSTERVEGAVSNLGIGRGDDGPEFAHAPSTFAENIWRVARMFTISASTSSRSCPFNASA